MSFVKTLPEAMTSAAGQLAGIGEALATENSAVAMPTTVIAPAGSDPVSQLQAGVFSTYGSLYQSISEQAAAVHQQLVQVLGQNAGAYSSAEATNEGTASMDSVIQSFLTDILGVPTSGSSSVLSGNLANIENIGVGNWASATSALLGMAGGGLLDFPEEIAAEGAGLVGYEAMPAGALAPATLAGAGMPAAGMAQTTMAAAPSWGEGVAASNAGPARLAAASTVTPAHASGMGAVPAAMPLAGAGDRGAGRFGAPRYGAKPTVMPKSKAV